MSTAVVMSLSVKVEVRRFVMVVGSGKIVVAVVIFSVVVIAGSVAVIDTVVSEVSVIGGSWVVAVAVVMTDTSSVVVCN
jgi:hypothetical protein